MVVDLPAPLGPRNPVTTPGFTTKLSPSTAALSPYLLVRPSIWSGHQSQSCCVLSSVVADDPNATGGVTSGHLSPDRTFPAAYALRHRPISRRGLVGTAPERRNRLAGQPDAEPGGGGLQQNLPGGPQDRGLGRAPLPARGPAPRRPAWPQASAVPPPSPRPPRRTRGVPSCFGGRSSRSSRGAGPAIL